MAFEILDMLKWGWWGNCRDGFVRVFDGGNNIMLMSFSDGLKTIQTSTQERVEFFKTNPLNLGFIEMKSNVYWLCETCLNENTDEVYALRINLKAAKFEGKPVLLSEVPRRSLISKAISLDSSQCIISYLDDASENDEEKMGVCVFNEKMIKKSKSDFTVTRGRTTINCLQVFLSTKGDSYLLIGKSDKNGTLKSLSILKTNKGTSSYEEIVPELEGRPLQSIKLCEYQAGNIGIIGYYYQKDKAIIGGLYMLEYNFESKRFEKNKKGYYDIPEELLLTFETGRAIRKSAKGVQKLYRDNLRSSFLEVTDVLTSSDGGVNVIGESRRAGTETTTHYILSVNYYDDIVVVHLKPNGDLGWVKRIPKIQKGYEGFSQNLWLGSCSYKAVMEGSSLYMVYLDNIKNETRDPGRPIIPSVPSSPSGLSLYCMKYDDAGSESKRTLMRLHEGKDMMCILGLRYSGHHKLVGFAGAFKNIRLCSIGLE
jgi:hypothetical protein